MPLGSRRAILVYVAGPYSAPTEAGVEANIAEARRAAIAVKLAGFSYFCPHLNSARFERDCPDVPHADWLTQDLLILPACHTLLLLPESELSVGTLMEWRKALDLGIPVFDSVDALCAAYPEEVPGERTERGVV